MISDRDIFSVGMFVLSFVLWTPLYLGYRKLKTDEFRHELLLLRDALFLKTYKMGTPFENKDYIELRRLINSYLRYAHRLNFWAILCIFLELKRVLKGKNVQEVSGAPVLSDTKSEEYKEFLKKTYSNLGFTLFSYTMNSSIVIYIIWGLYRLTVKVVKYLLEVLSSLIKIRVRVKNPILPAIQKARSPAFVVQISSCVDNYFS